MRPKLALAPVLALAPLLALGCAMAGGDESAAGDRAQAGGYAPDRLLLKTAELRVAVAAVPAAVDSASALATGMGGYVAGSSTQGEESARLELRVPAARLDEALGALAALGEERARSVAATDVTAEVADLEATLANQRALRDRLRALLGRAQKVEEVLQVERELTRLQTEIDAGEARLKRLQTGVALSALTLDLERKKKPRILGPLGYLFVGTKWLVTKLFVIRE
jgi:hypothetical protein